MSNTITLTYEDLICLWAKARSTGRHSKSMESQGIPRYEIEDFEQQEMYKDLGMALGFDKMIELAEGSGFSSEPFKYYRDELGKEWI